MITEQERPSGVVCPAVSKGQRWACHLQLWGGGVPAERLSVSVMRGEAVPHHPSVLTRMATKRWHDEDREALVSFAFLKRVMPAPQTTYGVTWARSGCHPHLGAGLAGRVGTADSASHPAVGTSLMDFCDLYFLVLKPLCNSLPLSGHWT